MGYLIYAGVAALVVWSVVCLWRNIRRQLKGECDGCCGTCSKECPSRSNGSFRSNPDAEDDAKTKPGGGNTKSTRS